MVETYNQNLNDEELQKTITANLMKATQQQQAGLDQPFISQKQIDEVMPTVKQIYEPQIKSAQESLAQQWSNVGRYVSGRSQQAQRELFTKDIIPQMTQVAMNLAQSGNTAKQQQLQNLISNYMNMAQQGSQAQLQKELQTKEQTFQTGQTEKAQTFQAGQTKSTQDWQSTQNQLDRDIQQKMQSGQLDFTGAQNELNRKLQADLQSEQLSATDKQNSLNRSLQQALQTQSQQWSTGEREAKEGMYVNVPRTDANGMIVKDASGNQIMDKQFVPGTQVETMKQQSLLDQALQMKDQQYQDKVRESMYGYKDPTTGEYKMGTQAMFANIQNEWETARQNTQNLFTESIQTQANKFQSNEAAATRDFQEKLTKTANGYINEKNEYVQGTAAKLAYIEDEIKKGQMEKAYNYNRLTQKEQNNFNAYQAELQRNYEQFVRENIRQYGYGAGGEQGKQQQTGSIGINAGPVTLQLPFTY